MIEKVVLDYLNKVMDTPAYMEETGQMPKSYILIDKTGSGRTNHINRATIAIQSFSTSRYDAAMLNEAVKGAMEQITGLDEVVKCSLNSDYDYTDTARKKYRYQAVFDLVHY